MLGLVKTNLDTAKSSISVGRFLQPKLWQKVATDQTTPSSVRKSRVGTLRMIEHAILMAFIGICVQGEEIIFSGRYRIARLTKPHKVRYLYQASTTQGLDPVSIGPYQAKKLNKDMCFPQ